MRLVRTEYAVIGNKPVVYRFTRDEKGRRRIEKDSSLRPYFCVPAGSVPHDVLPELNDLWRVAGKRCAIAVDGTRLDKIETMLPEHVAALRESFTTTYEADILFPTRYMIDRVDSIEPTNLRIAILDIETDPDGGGVPDPEKADKPVICVTIHDSQDNVLLTVVYRDDMKQHVTGRVFEGMYHETVWVNSEKDLLNTVFATIEELGPDVISGWYLNKFDLLYLINRSLRVPGSEYWRMSPMRRVYVRKDARDDRVVIKGVACVDLLDAYRKFTFSQEESYMLNAIALKTVGRGKLGAGSDVHNTWVNDIQQLVDYNAVDVVLVKLINDKRKLIDFLDEIRRLAFCQIEDALKASRVMDSYVLRMYHGKMVFPSKGANEPYRYEGAYVHSWASGLYDWVYTFDLKSLYPSIICSFAISPESIVSGPGQGHIHVNNVWIDQQKKGYLPEVVNSLFSERAKYKKLCKTLTVGTDEWKLADNRQFALKVLMNSLYGQMAYVGSRFYDPRVAETITFIGREIIKWTIDILTKQGLYVKYTDTDSCYWTCGEELPLDDVRAVRDVVNQSYDRFAAQYGVMNHIFSIEFEKVFRKAFFAKDAKKRYAGHCVYKSDQVVDELEVVGMEVKRSDSSRFSRALQKGVLDMILRHDKGERDVCEYIRGEMQRIAAGKYEYSEIGIPKGMTKDISEYKTKPVNIKAVLYSMNELGMELSSKPKMLYVTVVPGHKATGIMAFDEEWQVPEGTKVNVGMMMEKGVRDKLDGIFVSLGWDMGMVKEKWRQKGMLQGDMFSTKQVDVVDDDNDDEEGMVIIE